MKVKVKRIRGGSMGDQRDYGLVTGSIWNYKDKPTTNNVSGTMTPTSREDATIEAERGETVVGDLNNDGQLEHLKIGGKRHFQGGTPLNVPDGSFVFSDYNGLLIKNKEMLANVFNYKSGKSATPAKVAKRYELNRYNDILNDPNADFLDQKTAQLMIDNNLKKLGQLALVQESMKGFPDGIPAIALPLFGSDQPAPKQQVMKKGGLVKAQKGKNVQQAYAKYHPASNSPLKNKNAIIYYDKDNPDRYTPPEAPTMMDDFFLAAGSPFATLMSTGIRNGDWRDYVKERQNNPIDAAINAVALNYTMAPGMLVNKAPVAARTAAATYDWFANPYPFVKDYLGNLFNVPETDWRYQSREYGGQYMQGGGDKKKKDEGSWLDWGKYILGPAGVATAAYYGGKLLNLIPWDKPVYETQNQPFSWTNSRGTTSTTTLPEQVEVGRRGIKPGWKKIPLKGKAAIILGALTAAGMAYYDYRNSKNDQPSEEELIKKIRYDDEEVDDFAVADSVMKSQQGQPSVVTSITTAADSLPARQDSVAAPAKDSTKVRVRKSTPTASSPTYRRLSQEELDSLMSKRYGGDRVRMFQPGGGFAAYTPESRIRSTDDWEVVAPSQVIDFTFGAQSFNPTTQRYTAKDPDTGKFVDYDLDDLYNRLTLTEQETGLPILKTYDKGADQWKKDIVSSDEATRKKAVGHAQRAYNEVRTKLGLSPYFYGTPGSDPYGIDEMLGLYTFSMPGLRKKKKPETKAEPAKDQPVAEEEGATYTGPGFQGMTRPRSVGFSPQDIAGMMGIAGQEIPDYLLTSSVLQPSLISPAYTEFDPSATLGAYQAFLQNVGTGPQGKGAALSATGATGKTLEALNRERQANRASNLDTFLRTSAANQQALSQANLYNAEEQKAYIDRLNTLTNANVAARNKKLADFTERYSKGLTNIGKLNAINAMMPYQYSDWLTTSVNPTLRSIYEDPITGASAGSSFDAIYDSIFNQLVESGVDRKDAAIKATEAASRMASSSRSRGGYGTSGAASSIYDFMT